VTADKAHRELHFVSRVGWLRAAILGANDGIISTASLVVGVASASAGTSEAVVAGVAGLVAGALSMAAGEYVSVSSQVDTERAAVAGERRELARQPRAELDELTSIYVERGVEPELARQVAEQMTAKDALAAHVRDELGLIEQLTARPVQAALTSAATFTAGAALPLALVVLAPAHLTRLLVPAGSLAGLALLGAVGARLGGARMLRPILRITFWGVIAMAATAAIGTLLGHTV
jgi:vacuolar iron transporter family protein